jgi:hypothetical protein
MLVEYIYSKERGRIVRDASGQAIVYTGEHAYAVHLPHQTSEDGSPIDSGAPFIEVDQRIFEMLYKGMMTYKSRCVEDRNFPDTKVGKALTVAIRSLGKIVRDEIDKLEAANPALVEGKCAAQK